MLRPTWIMSPQARRRLQRTMTAGELRDLAVEIVADLGENAMLSAAVRGLATEVIYATITREL